MRGELTAAKVAAAAASMLDRRGSAVRRTIDPGSHEWDDTGELLAQVIDHLRLISWQIAGDGNRDLPSAYPRPGMPQANDTDIVMDEFDTPQEWDEWRAGLYGDNPETPTDG